MSVWQVDCSFVPRESVEIALTKYQNAKSSKICGQTVIWLPGLGGLWRKRGKVATSIEREILELLPKRNSHNEYTWFGKEEDVLMELSVVNGFIDSLVMRIALMPGPIPPPNLALSMQRAIELGFQTGAALCTKLALSTIIVDICEVEDFSNQYLFQERVRMTTAWRFCEELGEDGSR